jgi:hemoglobin
MPAAGICTEEEIATMVHSFYAKVRGDAVLGPIFGAHISDWDHHLPKMIDFWSSTLRGTARYRGTPMPKHAALPGLDAAKFSRWLGLFDQTLEELGNPALRERAGEMARRIAQSLWYGYQLSRNPQALPEGLEATAG